MQFRVYAATSVLILAIKLAHAIKTFKTVYPISVHLTTDRLAQAILLNFALLVTLSLARGLISIFCGRLRESEIASLTDSSKSFIADTLLFLVFYAPSVDDREHNSMHALALVAVVSGAIFTKFFHLVASERVGHMFELGFPTWQDIGRIGGLLGALLFLDAKLVIWSLSHASRHASIYSWLLFQAVSLLLSVTCTTVKLGLHSTDMRLERGLPGKAAKLFFVDLVTDILGMGVHLTFLVLFVAYNPGRLPLYALTDMGQVGRQLIIRIRGYRRYREVSRRLEDGFATATRAEAMEVGSCIICRDGWDHDDHHDGLVGEDPVAAQMDESLLPGVKKLACGHIFHIECLRNWFLMQQTCPTCRADVVSSLAGRGQGSRGADNAPVPDEEPRGEQQAENDAREPSTGRTSEAERSEVESRQQSARQEAPAVPNQKRPIDIRELRIKRFAEVHSSSDAASSSAASQPQSSRIVEPAVRTEQAEASASSTEPVTELADLAIKMADVYRRQLTFWKVMKEQQSS